MANNNNSNKLGIRSLVCDSNGIIIAEMVYRCMICSAIHDLLDDAQTHYQSEHIEDNDSDCKNRNNDVNSAQQIGGESDLEDEYDMNMAYELPVSLNDSSAMYDDSVASNNCNSLTVAVPANLRQLQYQSMSSSQSQSQSHNDGVEHNTANRAKPITFASPSNAFLLPYQSAVKPSPTKRFSGGFVTCEVCGLTKYYSHISRRYGVFSCESCAKFFYRYLLKPSKFTCPSNGNCSLKIDLPGGRCKACLLQACLQKYIIDPKRHPKIFQKTPVSGDKSSLIASNATTGPVPANVQIKISKQPNKLLINPTIKGAIKQESGIDDMSAIDALESNQLSSKPLTTNGVVIKSSHSSSSKRKQQFDEATTVTRSRRIGCRECPGCLADDCGQCLYCLDKPKFGGNDVKKQRCIKRRCHRANYT